MPKQKGNNSVRGKENMLQNVSLLPEEDDTALAKESFLRDFDIRVKMKTRDMEKHMNKILSDISRMATTEQMKLNKEICQMTVKEFLEKGGCIDSLQFKEVSSPSLDVSYKEGPPITLEDTVTSMRIQNNLADAAMPTTTKSTAKRVLRGKREAPESSLLRHAVRNTRTRKADFATPLLPGNKRFPGMQQELVTPMITPKFDVSKPLTAAREPIQGETLVSLAGSPVVKSHSDSSSDDTNLVSISLLSQQTVLGGRLFLDEGMSPNTLVRRKQIIEEAVHAINSRLEEINSQISAGSKLDES